MKEKAAGTKGEWERRNGKEGRRSGSEKEGKRLREKGKYVFVKRRAKEKD